jgi:hypothetical protein
MIFDKEQLDKYISDGDIIGNMLDDYTSDIILTSHRWLLESLPKRAIYYELYGDLILESTKGKKILDVGGGYCSLSNILIKNNDYKLLDLIAHDNHLVLRHIENDLGRSFWINKDWYDVKPDRYDIVIANDIFPNVDQRLDLFLKRYIPRAKEIRMSLTYYNTPRFYKTKRLDADEIFCQVSYDWDQIEKILYRYVGKKLEDTSSNITSIFENGRCVFILNTDSK